MDHFSINQFALRHGMARYEDDPEPVITIAGLSELAHNIEEKEKQAIKHAGNIGRCFNCRYINMVHKSSALCYNVLAYRIKEVPVALLQIFQAVAPDRPLF